MKLLKGEMQAFETILFYIVNGIFNIIQLSNYLRTFIIINKKTL